MVRTLFWSVLIIALLALAAVFGALNTGPITLNLAFTTLETGKAIVLLFSFAAGWLFGLICLGLFALRLLAERRRLRKSVRLAEEEVRALRSLPVNDAD